MSKLLLYFLVLIVIAVIALFGFFAFSTPNIDQNPITIDVETESFE